MDLPWNKVIKDKIEKAMYDGPPGDSDLSFITQERLTEVWNSSPDQFHDMQQAIGLHFEGYNVFVFDDHIKIISIFVLIQWESWQFVGQLCEKGFRDSYLPVPLRLLKGRWSLSHHSASAFNNIQYAFCPIVIERDRDLPCPRGMRLPIIEEEELGSGAYGAVTKVRIAHGYVVKRSSVRGSVYDSGDTVAARKKFHFTQDGTLEQATLTRLRNDNWQNNCIMNSFASVILGSELDSQSEYNLFFEYAPADLEKFLSGKADCHQQLGVKKANITPYALFQQLYDLADALEYLHSDRLSVCHCDLKLDNILIMPEDGYPIGKWKITDFGIASIEQKSPSEVRVIGDLRFKTARAQSKNEGKATVDDLRAPGPFQPPEVKYTHLRASESRYLSKGDIWSFGCVFTCVLVYAIGGTSLYGELQQLMTTSRRADWCGYFYSLHREDPQLYPTMVDWVQKLTKYCGQWAEKAWSDFALQMLKIDVSERIDAKNLAKDMKLFLEHEVPLNNLWDDMTQALPDPNLLRTSRILVNSTIQSRPRRPPPPPPPPPRRADVDEISPAPPRFPHHQTLTPMTLTDSFRQAETGDGDCHLPATPSISQHSDSHTPLSGVSSGPSFTGLPLSRDLTKSIEEKCHVIETTNDGSRALFLTPNDARFVMKDSNGERGWKLYEKGHIPIAERAWNSASLAGAFILLHKRLPLDEDPSVRLYSFQLGATEYKEDWDKSVVPDLASVTRIEVSAKGYIAFRSSHTKRLRVFNKMGHKLIDWDLDTAKHKDLPRDRGTIQAIAFDPSGDILVVVAWNCWFLWKLDDLQGNEATRCGKHEYTAPDHGASDCTLVVLDEGAYFLLHDQCKHTMYAIVETSGQRRALNISLEAKEVPKAQAIAISPRSDWLAYVADSGRFGTCHLYCCRIYNGDSKTADMPSFGKVENVPLSKIKTETVKRKRVNDVVLGIMLTDEGVAAVVSSITKHIEVIPLPPPVAGKGKKKIKGLV